MHRSIAKENRIMDGIEDDFHYYSAIFIFQDRVLYYINKR